MQIKKNLLGHTWRNRKHSILISEENAELLKKAGADVFDEVKEDAKKQSKEVKPKLKKYKGVKKDDVSDTEK